MHARRSTAASSAERSAGPAASDDARGDRPRHSRPRHSRPRLIVVGASLGGLDALRRLLAALPVAFPVPLAVVLHRRARPPDRLCETLQAASALPVREVEDKDEIVGGRVYLAPADYHLLVEDGAFSLSVDPPVQCARPSIDVLFESAADAFGSAVIGVVLTGASRDGADGAERINQRGGVVVVEEPRSAACRVMPDAAVATSWRGPILPIDRIGDFLVTRAGLRQ